MLLEEMTWEDAGSAIARGALFILPAGSVEQHGRHLPLSTDSLTARELAIGLADRVDAVVAPTLHYTPHSRPADGGGGMGFPGSIGVPARLVAELVEAIARDVMRQGFRRLLVLNAHFENRAPVIDALTVVSAEVPDSKSLLMTWTDVVTGEDLDALGFPAPGGFQDWAVEHAATTETSYVKHFAPHLVRDGHSGDGGVERRATYEVFPLPGDLVPSTGMMGEASHATPEFGQRLASLVLDRFEEVVNRELGV